MSRDTDAPPKRDIVHVRERAVHWVLGRCDAPRVARRLPFIEGRRAIAMLGSARDADAVEDEWDRR